MSTTPVVIQKQKQTQVMMKIIILLNALSWAASFQIGGGELGAVVPRRRWISTMFYANSQDEGISSQNAPRSLFSSPVQSIHSNNQAKKRGDSDEEAVDEYLAFLAKRYR